MYMYVHVHIHVCNITWFCVYRQLVQARSRIATGLKKLLETNDLVVNMEVRYLNH